MGTIGSFSLGKMLRRGVSRKKVIEKVKRKMQMWRDNARLNLIQNSIRYARKVELNRRLMEIRKGDRPKNLNPSVVSLQPKKRDKLGYNLSTIPTKPKYSDIRPRKRLYGMRLKSITSKRTSKQK